MREISGHRPAARPSPQARTDAVRTALRSVRGSLRLLRPRHGNTKRDSNICVKSRPRFEPAWSPPDRGYLARFHYRRSASMPAERGTRRFCGPTGAAHFREHIIALFSFGYRDRFLSNSN